MIAMVPGAVCDGQALVRGELAHVVRRMSDAGLPRIGLRGQLTRPLLAVAGATPEQLADMRFWYAAAAIQYAHEASLVHDDIIDGGTSRRDEPTLVAARGVAAALVAGDHLLTAAYRAAVQTESLAFVQRFARAVERTVAGEQRQARLAGEWLDDDRYRDIVADKSGELFGCALAAGAVLRGAPDVDAVFELGRRTGILYQRVDDLLDALPAAQTGKPALQDYAQRKWTWFLPYAGVPDFSLDPLVVAERLLDGAEERPIDRCCGFLCDAAGAILRAARATLPQHDVLASVVGGWITRACASARVQALWSEATLREAEQHIRRTVPHPAQYRSHFATNSRSFSLAASFFPEADRARVGALYCYCRALDDLTDDDAAIELTRAQLLAAWERLSRRAYDGTATGVPLFDDVMTDAARSGVPFAYVRELIEGMRMDLRPARYATLAELRVYTYRVAGVVGQWLTRLHGQHDARVLDAAASLGHALQLTNILRDVGEDWRRGRLYLPLDRLTAHGVTERDIGQLAQVGAVSARYASLVEELMSLADRDYDVALAALPALPRHFRVAAGVAARIYRGIHDEIRRNGYNNGTRRAQTSRARKTALAAAALVALRRGRPARAAVTATVALLLGTGPLAAQSPPPGETASAPAVVRSDVPSSDLERIRALYFAAVDESQRVEEGIRLVQHVAALAPERQQPLLRGYEGAFITLRARHGSWPPARLRAVKQGLAALDEAVAVSTDDVEVRYLRLMSAYYLPSFFGRRERVHEDFAVLTLLLPAEKHALPPALFASMAGFVIARSGLDDEALHRLREAAR